MLVLTRAENQSVVVGAERPLEVVVVSVEGQRVQLGFRDLGPHRTKVTRSELIAGADGAPCVRFLPVAAGSDAAGAKAVAP